jgi:MFS family permease
VQEQWGSDLEAVIRVMQIAIAPAFLLAAVASLLNVLTGRLARVVDRSREVNRLLRTEDCDYVRSLRPELAILSRRKRLIRASMLANVAAAIIICLMSGLLFVMGLTSYSQASLIIGMFAVAMVMVALSLIALLGETGLAGTEDEPQAAADGSAQPGTATVADAPSSHA